MDYRTQKIIAFVISIALAAAILSLMFFRVWNDLLIAVGETQYRYLFPALLFSTLSWFMRGYRYQKILHYLMVPASFLFSTACVLLSQTINLIVPARLGDFVRVVPLHHDYEATVSQGLSSLIIERLFDVLTVSFLGLIAIVFIIDVPDWFLSVIVLSLVITGIGMLFILISKEWKTKNKYLAFLLNMFHEIRAAALSRNAILILAGTSTIIWIFEILVCYFVTLMFQIIIPFNLILLAVVIGNLVKAVPITPGGIGTYELALAATFELGKVPAATATIVSVLDHFIKNFITLIGGAASILYFGTWVIPRITEIVKEKLSKE